MKDADFMKFAKAATQKINTQTQLAKLLLDKTSLEKELDEICLLFGKYCYKGMDNEGWPDDRVEEYRNNIAQISEELAQLQQESEELKKKK